MPSQSVPDYSDAHLTDEHRVDVLRARAVSDELITERGYWSDPIKQRLVIPLHDVHGKPRGNQYRSDDPEAPKYLREKGSGNFIDCPPQCRDDLADPSVPLYLVEGPIKADAIATAGGCALGLFGVWGFRGKNSVGGKTALRDFEYVALNGRVVYLVPDSDVRTNYRVQQAMQRLERAIRSVCSDVDIRRVVLPHAADGTKQGSDDFVAAGSALADLRACVDTRWPSSSTDTQFTDARMAEVVAMDVLEGHYVWCKALGWLGWDGKRYESVSDEKVREQVRTYIIGRYQAAAVTGASQEVLNKLHGLHSVGRLVAITKLATALVEVHPLEFDTDPDVLNCANGVVDLRSGELLPHDSERLITKLAPVNYVPGAIHPDWKAALTAIPEVAVRRWIQARMGQAITGHTPDDDVVALMVGGGENGKSTILGALPKVLGDYHVTLSDRVLMASWQNHPTELMDLMGARFAVLEETPEAAHLDTQRLKKIDGTEKITARRIAKDPVTFSATHSLFIATNHTPVVAETDHGTWRRLAMVEFPLTFRKPGQPLKNDTDRLGDPRLRPRIIAGRQGQHEAVLAWLVAGARSWYRADQIMPPQPQSVEKSTSAWRKRTDLVHGIWDELIVFDADRHVMASEFHSAVSDWLKRKGYTAWSDRILTERFTQHPTTKAHKITKANTKKSRKLSNRPQTALDFSRDPVPAQYKAWKGIRFRTLTEGVAGEVDLGADEGLVTGVTDLLDDKNSFSFVRIDKLIGNSGNQPGQRPFPAIAPGVNWEE